MVLGILVVGSMVLGSVSGAARCLSGARAAESGPVAAGWSLSGAESIAEAASERTSQASLAWEWYWGYWLWIIWCWGVLLKR
jgi:hypothetical protein